MTSPTLDSLITICDVLSSTLEEDGTILLQIGDAVLQEVDRSDAEYFSVAGLAARPANPQTATKASAQVISIMNGDQPVVIGSRDIVAQSITGSLEPGETCLYAPGAVGLGQGRILLKDSGDESSITLYTTQGNTVGGNSCAISLTSAPSFAVALGDKGAFTIDETGFKIVVGNVGIMGDAESGTLTIMGKELQLAGQKVLLGIGATGATAAVLAPPSAPILTSNAAVGLPCTVIAAASTCVMIAP